jgi:hypothetical protein
MLFSEETKIKMSIAQIGKKASNDTKQKISNFAKQLKECKYCHKVINATNHNRWHGENCKNK